MRGLITFLIALVYIYLGLTGWASKVTRGVTKPGYYQQQQLFLTGDGPQGYDSWINQLQRKRERGR